MAFMPNNLAVLSYAAGFTLWTYATVEDGVGTVLGDGYFDDARTYVRADDVILMNAADGARILRVVANDGVRVGVTSIAGDMPIMPPEIPGEAILDEAGNPILDEAGEPILQG
jgi:CubicO group peptidase (beta-lactamase class C family)